MAVGFRPAISATLCRRYWTVIERRTTRAPIAAFRQVTMQGRRYRDVPGHCRREDAGTDGHGRIKASINAGGQTIAIGCRSDA